MDRNRRSKPDWSSLPDDLLVSIAKLLHERLGILRFRAVCHSFRSSVPPPPKLQFPPSILTTNGFLRCPEFIQSDDYVVVESTLYAIQPLNKICNNETPQTWLVNVEEKESGKIKMKDPATGLCFKNLSKTLPKFLSLLDYRVTEITRSYTLAIAGGSKRRFIDGVNSLYYSPKVLLTTGIDETDERFAVMVKFGPERLSLWRSFDKKWTDLDHIDFRIRDGMWDIIYHNEKFYVLLFTGAMITVDSKSLKISEVAAPKNYGYPFPYLVESLKDLLLILKYKKDEDNEECFKVFKLDEQKHQWVLVMDGLELEDRVIFASKDSGSYSLSDKEFFGCLGNCVYYTKGIAFDRNGNPADKAWIFNLKDGKAGKLIDFLGYSNHFWPPPSWLKLG